MHAVGEHGINGSFIFCGKGGIGGVDIDERNFEFGCEHSRGFVANCLWSYFVKMHGLDMGAQRTNMFASILHDALTRGMKRLALTEPELEDLAEALDSPDAMEKFKGKLLVLRMHREGVDHGIITRAVRRQRHEREPGGCLWDEGAALHGVCKDLDRAFIHSAIRSVSSLTRRSPSTGFVACPAFSPAQSRKHGPPFARSSMQQRSSA